MPSAGFVPSQLAPPQTREPIVAGNPPGVVLTTLPIKESLGVVEPVLSDVTLTLQILELSEGAPVGGRRLVARIPRNLLVQFPQVALGVAVALSTPWRDRAHRRLEVPYFPEVIPEGLFVDQVDLIEATAIRFLPIDGPGVRHPRGPIVAPRRFRYSLQRLLSAFCPILAGFGATSAVQQRRRVPPDLHATDQMHSRAQHGNNREQGRQEPQIQPTHYNLRIIFDAEYVNG